jgi:hypothetical protein
MRESVQGWRLKWFYLREPSTAGHVTRLPKFVDVLEAMPKQSWKNILTAEEMIVADKLFERILETKESDGQTMIGTEIVAVFLRRRVQPAMSRAHQMWMYSGPKDETRNNAAELLEKELLDEVRRLTYFSQEDSIPLLALHDPYDLSHQPSEVIFGLPLLASIFAFDIFCLILAESLFSLTRFLRLATTFQPCPEPKKTPEKATLLST